MWVNENLILRNIYGKNLLMPVRKSEAGIEPIFLNDMGAEIWQLSNKGLTRQEIIQNIDIEYDLDHGSVEEKAVSIFIDNLVNKKIIYE